MPGVFTLLSARVVIIYFGCGSTFNDYLEPLTHWLAHGLGIPRGHILHMPFKQAGWPSEDVLTQAGGLLGSAVSLSDIVTMNVGPLQVCA